MELSFQVLIMLPVGLGLLGFIEPCTIGGHLLFLDTQKSRSRAMKIKAVMVFVLVRSLIAGVFGAIIALIGQKLIGVQTGIWLVFGSIYLAVGLAFMLGQAGLVKQKITLAPAAWKKARSPWVLGLAFGLNIPACAAPILFGLLGLVATTGTVLTGFWMMFLFGLFLSLPLVVFAMVPRMADWLDRMAERLVNMRWIIGGVFVLLGLWSIWFGLYVDPANWVGT
ncbi:MAG: sulfite exporter TauE/SafE family protein [Rhodobacteraceae bacterium]|nr:sulfite exporter TauE/SafE family protein [Paracoccaceae bacterium]